MRCPIVLVSAAVLCIGCGPQSGDGDQEGKGAGILEPVEEATIGAEKPARSGGTARSQEDAQGKPRGKASLLNELKKKGDSLAQGAFANCFVAMYTDRDTQAETRLPFLMPNPYELSETGTKGIRSAVSEARPEIFQDWPERSMQADQVELRLLLDDTIIPSLEFGYASAGGTTYRAFSQPPESDVKYVRESFGPPTQERQIGENTLLSYGRLRLLVDSTGKIIAVYF